MTTFSHIFRSTRDLAISQGRRPVVCLLGPDMQVGFKDYCWGLFFNENFPSVGDPSISESTSVDLGELNGIRIRKMSTLGLAIITTPAPESGFDV
jgi:hypothetical protein